MSIFIPPLPLPIRPEALDYGEVSGKYPAVWHFSETCVLVNKTLRETGVDAHAHSCHGGMYYGLICVRPHFAEYESILAHEYAHLLIGPKLRSREWQHGPRWRKTLADLGFPDEADEYVGWRD